MDKNTKNVVIGLLGARLDMGRGSDRWAGWRPSVAICQHEELLIDRFELLHQDKDTTLAQELRDDIAAVSPETEVLLHAIDLPDPWDFEGVYSSLHDFTRTYPFDVDTEDYLVHITTGTHVAQICLFLLTESRHLPGKLIQTSPPKRRFKEEACGHYRIIDLDLSRYDQLAMRFEQERRQGSSFLKSGIETRNAAFNQQIDMIEQVVISSEAPILLMGPTGAGKSQLARRIFELKQQRQQVEGRFVEVNCATIRGDHAMSALFGHVAGAFTGATGDRPGLLCAAHDGMLFLDEIGELGLDEQAMLLRAIEEQRFLPVGADEEMCSQFQLIAGTNRDLIQEVEQGRFREDLLARIDLWTFRMPGLADRREDIEPNLDYELERYAAQTGRKVTINREARRRFLDFATSSQAIWKANFRDLGGAVTRMATLAPGGRINVDIVAAEIERLRATWNTTITSKSDQILAEFLPPEKLDALDRFDRVQLAEVLQACRESQSLSAAGRALFDRSRLQKKSSNDADRLRKYLARFDLQWSDVRDQ